MLTTISMGVPNLDISAPTESKTLLKARISASILSFLAWSCAKDKPAIWIPFVVGADVGPEGTVGACRFSILSGNPISRI